MSHTEAKRWLAFDIGCIECGENSQPIGLFPTKDEARQAVVAARERQQADWHGQHSFEVFDLAELLADQVGEPG